MIFGVFVVFGGINNAVTTRLKNMKKRALKNNHELTPAQLYRNHQMNLAINIFVIIAILFIAAGIFASMESWSFIEGLYFAVQTATVSCCKCMIT